MTKIGFLITNLGTPASTDVADVRAYLREFLLDPYVVDLPKPLRQLLVNAVILPFRPKKSAHAYAAIWTDRGSPLMLHSEDLLIKLRARLPGPVELAMRYGQPSIEQALHNLNTQGVQQIVAVPLYPQYADSTVTTTIDEINRLKPATLHCDFVTAFFDDQDYLDAQAQCIRDHLPQRWDHLLMSYHGLPERQLKKADPTGNHCLQTTDCCNVASPAHATCYRHQVYATSTALAQALDLQAQAYSVSFQSRLGGGWVKPYTDEVLQQLPKQGVKHLAVTCPAFVADNLETLEEIGIQGRQTFLDNGGESFHLIPCMNDDEAWVEALTSIIKRRVEAA